jgi:peptidyl-dipeptidase A
VGQQWNRVYDDLLKPYPGPRASNPPTGLLQKQKWDAVKMTKSAENLLHVHRFPALPQTFWERSMLTRPRDREVVCHASAWDMDDKDDVRIKMCIEARRGRTCSRLPRARPRLLLHLVQGPAVLFQDGAHDGFHEAIGDAINLSVTPAYLRKIGLVGDVKPSKEAVINQQMKMALDKIAFLPFGKLIDQWRWGVFSGRSSRRLQQGLVGTAREVPGRVAPVARTRGGLRSGREVPHPGQHAVHALLPVVHPAVPVPQGAVRCRRVQGPLNECSIFGSTEPARSTARCWRSARASRGRTRSRS